MPISLDNLHKLKPVRKKVKYNEFEKRVKEYVERKFKTNFSKQSVIIGTDNKFHEFDLVSENKSIFIECKNIKWTKSDKTPSAKISGALADLFFLSRVEAKKKILVMNKCKNHRGLDIVRFFVEKYGGLADETEIWRFIENDFGVNDTVEILSLSGENWYKKLFIGEKKV